MKSLDDVGVVFVNTVVGRGVLNGIVNLSFGTLLFTPSDDGKTIDPDLVVSARLRMDKLCAQQLHETLGELLVSIEKAEADAVAGVPEADDAALGKPN